MVLHWPQTWKQKRQFKWTAGKKQNYWRVWRVSLVTRKCVILPQCMTSVGINMLRETDHLRAFFCFFFKINMKKCYALHCTSLLNIDIICVTISWGRFKSAYELLNLRALKISMLHKNHTIQCMGKIFCFFKGNFKGNLWNSTHAFKDVDFIHGWKFKSS